MEGGTGEDGVREVKRHGIKQTLGEREWEEGGHSCLFWSFQVSVLFDEDKVKR